MRAKDIMTVNVLTVSPETSVRSTAQVMLDCGISGLPVVNDEGELVGMITEGDLMRRFELRVRQRSSEAAPEQRAHDYLKAQSWRVGDAMTPQVVTIDEDMPIGQIAALLEEHGIKRTPVMRQKQLVGIVSRADLLHGLLGATWEKAAAGDDATRLATLTRLREDAGIRDECLSVTVNGGIVHLWGSVGSQAERDAAQAVAENVRAAVGVENHIRVTPAHSDMSAKSELSAK